MSYIPIGLLMPKAFRHIAQGCRPRLPWVAVSKRINRNAVAAWIAGCQRFFQHAVADREHML